MSKVNPPPPPSEIDFDESRGYLDSPAFVAYCETVKTAIDHGAITIGDMKRELKTRFNEQWHIDALDALRAIGSIRQLSFVSPLRWGPNMPSPDLFESRFNNRRTGVTV